MLFTSTAVPSTYSAVAISLILPLRAAIAFTVVLPLIAIGTTYFSEAVVGSVPSRV